MSAASIKTIHALPPTELNSYKKATKLFETKQFKKGTQVVNDILKKFPDVGEVLALRGLLLMSQKRKPEALESIQRGLRNNVKSQFCWHALGMYHQDDNKIDEAIKSFRNAYRCQPGNFKLLLDLSLLEIKVRDLESYRETKLELLRLKPNQSGCWISYAMAFHLLGDLQEAAKIMEQYYQMEPLMKTINYETSEFKLYMNMIYREAGMHEKAIKLLEEDRKTILDKTLLLESLGDCYLKTNQKDKGAKAFEDLLERNWENDDYFKNLEQCLSPESVDKRVEFYKTYSEKYPRADAPRRIPLEFLTGDLFKQALDKYMQRAIHRCVPPLFQKLKYLFTDQDKQKTALELALNYAQSLEQTGSFGQGEKEPPTSLLWTYYYLAKHYDWLNETQKALDFVNKAIAHTPTVIELYLIKGKIYKHAGDVHEAAKWLEEAQSLDTSDRGVNFKCAKYMLRAGIIDEAIEITAQTIPDEKKPMEFLKEIQCIWLEIEIGEACRRARKYGEALHKFYLIDQHFKDIIRDEFDFHIYCMRKMTLSAYVNMLRQNDKLRGHPHYLRAAKNAIEIYLEMHDKAERSGAASAHGEGASEEGLSASELKKLKNKQKKKQLKAEQEYDTKKKEVAVIEKKDEKGPPLVLEHDPAELENPQDPLEETLKFLKNLEKYGQAHLETHTLGFEVYMRKKRFLLMLRSLKKIKQIEETQTKPKTKFHYYLCKFLIEFNKLKSTLNENVLNVIGSELKSVLPIETPVSVLNEEFLKKNGSNYECVIEAAKIIYDLKPGDESARKQSIDLLTNLNTKPSLKTLDQVVALLTEREYLGNLPEETISSLKSKLRHLYPHATSFKTASEVETGLAEWLKTLKIGS